LQFYSAIPSLREINRLGCLRFFTKIGKLRLHGSVQSAKVSPSLKIYFADKFVIVTQPEPVKSVSARMTRSASKPRRNPVTRAAQAVQIRGLNVITVPRVRQPGIFERLRSSSSIRFIKSQAANPIHILH
jgi:hypothetical protein